MVRRDDMEEQKKQHWLSREARERERLSASVEATLAEHSSLTEQDDEEDELEERDDSGGGPALIPPRLSMQSKLQPVVRPEEAASAKEEAVRQSAGVLAQFTQRFTSALGFTRQPAAVSAPPSMTTPPQTEERPPRPVEVREATPASRPGGGELRPEGPRKARGLGQMTRVRLEAAPKTEGETLPPELLSTLRAFPQQGTVPQPGEPGVLVRARPVSPPAEPIPAPVRETSGALPRISAGGGLFARGQSEVAVTNTRITDASVVLVMLTDDPGPVVVQYISLNPGAGFTVHLSAPTGRETPFNYVILTGEPG